MSISKNDLTISNRQLKLGEKVVILGNDIAIPVDNTQLSFSFSQLVGYDQNEQPIIQQLSFNGSNPVLTNKQVESDIVDIKSVTISMVIHNANENFPNQALGVYTITNTVTTNWNNYVWKNENNYQIIKQNNNWVVEKDEVVYATNNTNNPLNNSWDNITNITQVKFNNYQTISFFRCINLLQNNTKWIGEQCKFNKNTNQFMSLNKQKEFSITNDIIPIQNCYYVVLDYSFILTECNRYYYYNEDDEANIISSSSSDFSSSIE